MIASRRPRDIRGGAPIRVRGALPGEEEDATILARCVNPTPTRSVVQRTVRRCCRSAVTDRGYSRKQMVVRLPFLTPLHRFDSLRLCESASRNTNNVFCEIYELHRAIERGGKPSRKYKPSTEPMPPAIPGFGGETSPATTIEIPEHILRDVTDAVPGGTSNTSGKTRTNDQPHGDDTGQAPNGYPSNGQDTGGRDTGQQVAFYIYRDARERFYLGVKRTTTKQFPQYHWNGKQWIKDLPKGFLKIPYRLPELLDGPADAWVVIAAGEKDAETAVRLGFVATTNPGGEGKGQWTPELNKWFSGKKRAAIMEDNDKAGHAHVIEVAKALRGVVPDIRIVQFRELSEHGDLTDWVEAGAQGRHAHRRGQRGPHHTPAPARGRG
jgi:hypothetical protein